MRVAALPQSRAKIVPLKYEEARILGFSEADAYFQPDDKDRKILRRLFGRNMISMGGNFVAVGGLQIGVQHARDVICRNRECEFFDRRVYFDVIAAIPPIRVRGSDKFWHEFQGGGDAVLLRPLQLLRHRNRVQPRELIACATPRSAGTTRASARLRAPLRT